MNLAGAHGRLTPAEGAVTWYLCFPHALAAGAPPRWWQRPLRRGFRHVWACRSDGPRRTLQVEHVGTRLCIRVEDLPLTDVLAAARVVAAPAMLAARQPEHRPRAVLRGPMSCVETCKALLGIRDPLVLTPRQLWNHCRAHGARVAT